MMSDYVDDAAAESRFLVALLSIFAALALILATVGLYGVITYSAGLRTREIGIRLALGARPGDIVRLVIGDAMGSAATGMAIGIAAAILLTRSFRSLLFGVGAADPLTLTVVALVLSLVAVFASFVPARRATRVDPTLALQAE
jgi:putative ABC transport system permease protein